MRWPARKSIPRSPERRPPPLLPWPSLSWCRDAFRRIYHRHYRLEECRPRGQRSPPSFRGAPKREPGISRDNLWIPGPREDACPGMTMGVRSRRLGLEVAEHDMAGFLVHVGLEGELVLER